MICEQPKSALRPTYEYQRLPDNKTHVRRLILEPSKGDGLISGDIDCPYNNPIRHLGYRCLSYMWGDSTSDHEIVIKGSSMKVGRNLHNFLKYASGSLGLARSSLWIDAICINQKDFLEKNVQVANMAEIYRYAAETIVWLGNEPNICAAIRHIRACDWRHFEKTDVKIVEALGKHEYWQRTWVTQEILMSRKIKITAGDEVLDWTHLGAMFDSSLDLLPNSTPRGFWLKWKDMRKDEGGYAMLPDTSLTPEKSLVFWDLFEWRASTYCADNRDRIYAMINLTAERGGSFRVNYREDILDLFLRAGDHFHIWFYPWKISTLFRGLKLTTSDLVRSLENNPNLSVSLRVTQVHNMKWRARLGMARPICPNQCCEVTLSGNVTDSMSQYKYVLCTHDEVTSNIHRERRPHVLVAPHIVDGKGNGALNTTLIIPGYRDIAPVFCNTQPLEVQLYPSPYGSKDRWIPLTSWSDAQRYFNGKKTSLEKRINARVDGFRFRIGASFALDMLQRFQSTSEERSHFRQWLYRNADNYMEINKK